MKKKKLEEYGILFRSTELLRIFFGEIEKKKQEEREKKKKKHNNKNFKNTFISLIQHTSNQHNISIK